jgi:hypothetical protein
MSKTLFDIGADFAALEELLQYAASYNDGNASEETVRAMQCAQRDFDKWATELDTDQSTKIDNYRAYIRRLESEIAVAKAMKEQYAAEQRTRENRIEWLKSRLKAYMEGRGITKIVTDTLGEVRIQANGGVQALEIDQREWTQLDVDAGLADLQVVPNKDNIRDWLKYKALPFARLLPKTSSLRIK